MMIRPYRDTDANAVRFVCLNSEGPCTESEDTKHFILTTYCDYYIEKEPENCFVAADAHDNAVGYVICTEDYDLFRPVFLSDYLPRIPKSDARHYAYAIDSTVLQEKYKSRYPAHLHIDLLPDCQRQGIGTKLVDTLRSHLSAKGVPGVMLTVGATNHVGRSFYEKYGFVLLEENDSDAAYGVDCMR